MMLNELKNAGILSDDVIKQIKEMKGFRNLLVHRYGPLDDKVAYEDIKMDRMISKMFSMRSRK